MEPLNGSVVWAKGHMMSTTKPESVIDEASGGKDRGCSWPPKKAEYHHSQMTAAWRNNSDLPGRQMQEPQAGGVPRSVLKRLLAIPSAPGSPIGSPRRRCASASVVAMVHSPRGFVSSEKSSFEKRDPAADTASYQWCSPTFAATEFGSYESSSNCSSQSSSPIPIGRFSDQYEEEDEIIDEVMMLRQQVALLVKSVEHEKKRRASEQHLMQKKIIELQSLIRENGHEDDHEMDFMKETPSSTQIDLFSTRENELENNQTRRWSAPVYEDEGVESLSSGCLQKKKDANEEEAAAPKHTRLRARMHAIVVNSQRETQTLRTQLESAKRSQTKRENEFTLETTVKITALEQKHAAAEARLTQKAANSAAQVKKLEAEKLELVACMQVQQERLKQLELALGGKQIVDDSR
ncbi:hypothetical protein DD238_005536 [Peronospora effusa]|uniref:Uncharacterized protein n=1 Tax=Peronospora effusa TaxID=542832 RepID=A0A3M6VC05_9STRA|nr:hypothetical protein DD238_005536 [Peronospora effusa]